jgi:DNA modification methylase
MPGTIYYGDNLAVLRQWIADESVDLIYLDPPFNSKRAYHQSFRGSAAQERVFKDYWEWDEAAEAAYRQLTGAGSDAPRSLVILMEALYRVLEKDRDTLAYLSMMALRLVELHRVLKPTGSIYLHCDPTASHYLKVLMDAAFGASAFRNEITWKRSSAHSDVKQGRRAFGNVSDTLLYYTKSDQYTFNPQYTPYDREYLEKTYSNLDPDGRRWKSSDLTGPGGAAKGNPFFEFLGVKRYWRFTRKNLERLNSEGRIYQSGPGAVPRMKHYLDEMVGVPLQNIWDDIRPVSSHALERLGYPTQKPVALLDRIVSTSSHVGDLVLDPFCGCGTTIEACEKLARKWVGIDVVPRAVDIIRDRLAKLGVDPAVVGWPMDLVGARRLAEADRIGFQRWVVFMAGGRLPDGRQYVGGADGGVDGEIVCEDSGRTIRSVISVKGGNIGANDIRMLRHVVDESRAHIGVLISIHEPSKTMREIARQGGFFGASNGRDVRKLQLLTAEQILSGSLPDLPGQNVTRQSSPRGPRKGQTLALPFGPSGVIPTKSVGTPGRLPQRARTDQRAR